MPPITPKRAWKDILFRIRRIWEMRFRMVYVQVHGAYIMDDIAVIRTALKNSLTRFAS